MGHKLVSLGLNAYPRASLEGCVPDSHHVVEAWKALYHVPKPDRLQLLDGEADAAAAKESLRWLVKDATPHQDVLVWHMSSHGTQTRDTDGDERVDFLDETLCPIDFDPARPETWLTDDWIGETLRDLPAGVNLTLVVDACHSGSLLRAGLGVPAQLPRGRARSYPVRPTAQRASLLAPAAFGWRSLLRMRPVVRTLGAALRGRRACGLLISATTAAQLAADAFIDGQAQGAHTWAFLKALRADPEASYARLVARMRGLLNAAGYGGPGRDQQQAQLQGHKAHFRLPVFQPIPRP